MITASVVIYNTKKNQIESLFESVKNSRIIDRLYVIDNSSTVESEEFIRKSSISSIIEYIPHENTGYGSSHNIAIKKSIEAGANYHIVLNPDIRFENNVISSIYNFMENNKDVVYLLPNVTYPDGKTQYLCKLLPTPKDLIIRRFLPQTPYINRSNDKYLLKSSGYNKVINPPCLSGCFMFLRNSTLKDYNIFFDDRFFMYFEDFDLIRRLHRVGKTLFYPEVTIIHDHAKESYKSKKMLKIHIKSAIKYFNKYGWMFDKERRIMNKRILKEIKDLNK